MIEISTKAKRPRKRRPLSKVLVPYLFLLPFVSLFTVFVLTPMLYTLYLRVFRTLLIGGRKFIGAEIYLNAVSDPKLC